MSPHGTRSRYANEGCRCEPCKRANSEYSRRYYKADPERARENSATRYASNPEGQAARSRKWTEANKEHVRERDRAYRAALHPLYKAWSAMKQRCQNPRDPRFRDYGGRGIAVCDEWQSFEGFRSDVESSLGPRPEGCSLDRIDNDGPYAPGNVRWATASQQQRNRRRG